MGARQNSSSGCALDKQSEAATILWFFVYSLFALARTISQAEVVEEVKRGSSKWMKADGGVPGFTWQAGYSAFSIGESQVESVIAYIQNQEQHHQKLTFQEEFRRFLDRYRLAYDERYVWD